MCLAVPGRVVRWICREGPFAEAEVEFEQTRRQCHMACVPEAEVEDYVLVHAGIAIARVNSAEAQRILSELRTLGGADESEGSAMP